MSEVIGSLKDYFATKGKEKLKEKIKGAIVGGLELYVAGDLIPSFIKKYGYPYIHRNLKQHYPVGEKVLPALVLQFVIPEKYEESAVSEIIDLMALDGVREETKIIVDKRPVCIAVSETEIECYNFDDLANAEVFLDGSKLTSGTDYSVSDNKITLSTAMESGEHDLVVVDGTGKKAFEGKIYV